MNEDEDEVFFFFASNATFFIRPTHTLACLNIL